MEEKIINELAHIHYALTWIGVWLFFIGVDASTISSKIRKK